MLAYSLFYLAMCLGKWYTANVLSPRDDMMGFELKGDVTVDDFYNQVGVFVTIPMILAAALGGLYEYLWKLRENMTDVHVCSATKSQVSVVRRLQSMFSFHFRPLQGLLP